MDHQSYVNADLQRSFMYGSKAQHQLTPPSMRLYNDLHPLVNSGMYLPPAPVTTLPAPFLNDYPASFTVGPRPYGGYHSLPSGHPYLPSMDYGYGFPGRIPLLPIPPPLPPPSFMSSKHPDDTVWRAPYPSHMNALCGRLSSLNHSNPPDMSGQLQNNSSHVLSQFGGTVDDTSDAVLGQDLTACGSERDANNAKFRALPKLHARGKRSTDCVSSPTQTSVSGSSIGHRNPATHPPPLHLPAVRSVAVSQPPLLQDNSDVIDMRRTKSPSCFRTPGEPTDEDAVVKVPKLPPLLVGNRDLARKLNGGTSSEGVQSSRETEVSQISAHSNQNCAPSHQDQNFNDWQRQTSDVTEYYPPGYLSPPRRSWLQGVPPEFGTDQSMTDVEVMQQAYSLNERQPLSVESASNRSQTGSKRDDQRAKSSGKHQSSFLKPNQPNQSTPYCRFPIFRKDFSKQSKRQNELDQTGILQVDSVQTDSNSAARTSNLLNFVTDAPAENSPSEVVVTSSCSGVLVLPSTSDAQNSNDDIVRVKQEFVEALDFTRKLSLLNRNQTTGDTLETDEAIDLVTSESRCHRESDHKQFPLSVGSSHQPSSETVSAIADVLNEISLRRQYSSVDPQSSALPVIEMTDDRSSEFRCHLCNYSGRSQHCLNKHFRAHSQACKICRYCYKAFERPSDLVRHEERHQKRNHVVINSKGNQPLLPSDDAVADRKRKNPRLWSCNQCDFSCLEARKLIAHTRKTHPIHFECQVCHENFYSEADHLDHKLNQHPEAIGRIDTYQNGVVTATKLVSCQITGQQEVSISLLDLQEIPDDCSGIPEVSSLNEVQLILSKTRPVETTGMLEPVPEPPAQQLDVMQLMLSNASLTSPRDPDVEKLCANVTEFDNHSEVLDLSFSALQCSDQCDNLETTSDISPISLVIKSRTYAGISEPPATQTNVFDSDDALNLVTRRPSAESSPVNAMQASQQLNSDTEEQTRASDLRVTHKTDPIASHSTESVSLKASEELTDHSSSTPAHASSKSKSVKTKPSLKIPEILSETEISCVEYDLKPISLAVKTELVETLDSDGSGKTLSNTIKRLCIDKPSMKESTFLETSKSCNSLSAVIRASANSEMLDSACNGFDKKSSTYVCVRCKYSTNAKFKYQQHLKAHNGRFICKRCNKACLKSSDLYRHWVTHNVKGPDGYFACDSCDFTSPQKYVIENHMKKHYTLHPEQTHRQLSIMSRCGICQKNVLRSRLFEHKRVVHGKFFVKPRNGGESGGNVEMDANGNSIKSCLKTFTCPQCDRKFTTPSYLLRHHFQHHQQSGIDGDTKLDDGACCCRFCGIKFEDVDRLQDHETNHILQTCSDTNYINRCRKRRKLFPESTPAEPKIKSPAIKSPVLKSTVLKSSVGDLKSPRKSPHRRRLSCPKCKKHFKLQYFLDQHMRIHSDERPYVCQWCGASFAIYQYLNIHRRFKCPNRKVTIPPEKVLGQVEQLPDELQPVV